MARKPSLLGLYRRLRSAFGPRGWWPTTPPRGARPVYRPGREGRRLAASEALEVAVGAVLTQNAAWANAAQAVSNLRRAGLLEERRILAAPASALARRIRPAGYWRLKARRLRNLLDAIRAAGSWRRFVRRPTAALRAVLLGVSGVGPETADSILLYAARRPVFVVDAYTRRVLERHGYIRPGAPYADVQRLFHRALRRSVPLFNDFHAQFVEVGKRYCRKTDPLCEACPLRTVPFAPFRRVDGGRGRG